MLVRLSVFLFKIKPYLLPFYRVGLSDCVLTLFSRRPVPLMQLAQAHSRSAKEFLLCDVYF